LANFNAYRGEAELSAGLNAEGSAMGHCVGGYCDDVASRGTKIYSLRDKNNNPHVTVETRPGSRVALDKWGARKALSELDELQPGSDYTGQYFRAAGHPDVVGIESQLRAAGLLDLVKSHLGYDKPLAAEIAQIKGKQNAAPVDKYLPYVQDFVKSGQWGRVGDLGNAGLIDLKTPPHEGASRYWTEEELRKYLGGNAENTPELIERAISAYRNNYARGGSVIKQPRVTSRFAAALTAKG
jgi:hypothetical protein